MTMMRRFDGTAGRRWWHSSSMSRAKIKQSIRHKGINKCKKGEFCVSNKKCKNQSFNLSCFSSYLILQHVEDSQPHKTSLDPGRRYVMM